jgi:hypothetical protein
MKQQLTTTPEAIAYQFGLECGIKEAAQEEVGKLFGSDAWTRTVEEAYWEGVGGYGEN